MANLLIIYFIWKRVHIHTFHNIAIASGDSFEDSYRFWSALKSDFFSNPKSPIAEFVEKINDLIWIGNIFMDLKIGWIY